MTGPPKKLLGKPSEDSDDEDDDDDDDNDDDDDDDDDDVAAPPLEGMYDPAEYENLNVQVGCAFDDHSVLSFEDFDVDQTFALSSKNLKK